MRIRTVLQEIMHPRLGLCVSFSNAVSELTLARQSTAMLNPTVKLEILISSRSHSLVISYRISGSMALFETETIANLYINREISCFNQKDGKLGIA